MKVCLRYISILFLWCNIHTVYAQVGNNCANAISICNNQLAEQLTDGFGTQDCPTGGCG